MNANWSRMLCHTCPVDGSRTSMLDNVSFLLLFVFFRSFFWRSEKKKSVNERLKKEHKSLKSKIEEQRYINEEKDKMAIEVFENWLVSHTSINMSVESVFLFIEHFYGCIFMFLYSCARFSNIQILFFYTSLFYFSYFPPDTKMSREREKKEEMRIDLGTHN